MEQLQLARQELRQEEEQLQPEPAPSQGGVDSIPAALMRETDRNQIGTEQKETSIGFDGREHLHDSDGSKTFGTGFSRFLDPRGEDRPAESCLERGKPKGDGLSKRSTPLTPN